MSIEIKCPVSPKNGNGYFPRIEPLPQSVLNGMASPGDLIRGFVLEDTAVGTLSTNPDSGSGLSVIYVHNKTAENAIWFFSLTGERGLVNVISVPIHDHSSIVQGGPAFGTYFDDEG
jgi:hypothetical protein